MSKAVAVFWFRRGLRLEDNVGLFHALTGELPVVPIFIFDPNILEKLNDSGDARVGFIHQEVERLHRQLKEAGKIFYVLHKTPLEAYQFICKKYKVKKVYTNHDYEPYAIKRDKEIEAFLKDKGIAFHSYKDQVIFEKSEVVKEDGDPYVVFTPYSRVWKEKWQKEKPEIHPSEGHVKNFLSGNEIPFPSLEEIGFKKNDKIQIPARFIEEEIIRHYDEKRNFPAKDATSRLGIHLRFGTVSIRKLALKAAELNEVYLNELIWREFYMQILYHFPHVVEKAFKPAYEKIPWRYDENEFEKWKKGKTGYPLVDAGMRQLNATGYMHNRVRMVVASFLTKHLLMDWKLGEAYFAEKLLDFELASNNGGWQWAAGTGTDAQPYFRIFNPTSQQKKFDPDFKYIRKWVPEWGSPLYPAPVVEHKKARERALETFKSALKS